MNYRSSLLALLFLLFSGTLLAQPGIAEMNQATGNLRSTFFSARDATLVLAGLLGICGAVNIYYNWQMGRDKVDLKVAGWFFAAFFMILMGPFLQVLFGI
ncbi:DUF4134 family protein [Pedobacter sp. GR22-6]|uniref:DUF4134 family protein n=1 Tax=Pedobacter sp. GR22-6 TaxID=3127957 RepID=UPI00307EF0A7